MKNLIRNILDSARMRPKAWDGRGMPYTIHGSGVMRTSASDMRKHAKDQFDAAAKIKPGTVIHD